MREGTMTERPTILIVDDEAPIRRSLQRLFAREHYRVLEASGGQEALKIADTDAVDLIISDYVMPDGNGLDLLTTMKKRHPRVVRMIMTGKADLQTVITAINEGHVYRFILKPWDNDDLCLSVRLALEQATLLSENRRLVGRLQEQEEVLRGLAKRYPGITSVERDAEGAIVLDDPDEAAA
jgi:DNA-binding NtrC family response regulator